MAERSTGSLRFDLKAFGESDPALRLLVIFGSKSRGDAAGRFDFEFAYLARSGFSEQTFLEVSDSVLGGASVCLVNLRTASLAQAFRAAREGAVIYEREKGLFDRFRMRTIHSWCDLEPVVRAAHDRAAA
jgi:hypothetical protein